MSFLYVGSRSRQGHEGRGSWAQASWNIRTSHFRTDLLNQLNRANSLYGNIHIKQGSMTSNLRSIHNGLVHVMAS